MDFTNRMKCVDEMHPQRIGCMRSAHWALVQRPQWARAQCPPWELAQHPWGGACSALVHVLCPGQDSCPCLRMRCYRHTILGMHPGIRYAHPGGTLLGAHSSSPKHVLFGMLLNVLRGCVHLGGACLLSARMCS